MARSAITTGAYRRSAFQPRLQDLFKGTKTGRNSWGRIRNVLNSTVPTLGQCNSCPSAGRNACPSRKSRDISIVDLSAGLNPPFCPNCSPGYCHRHRDCRIKRANGRRARAMAACKRSIRDGGRGSCVLPMDSPGSKGPHNLQNPNLTPFVHCCVYVAKMFAYLTPE